MTEPLPGTGGQAAAVEQVAAAPVVLFDFDGVLLHGDAFYLFMRECYLRAPWRLLLALVCAPALLLQLPFSRRLPLRALVHVALVGVREPHYQRVAEAFAAKLAQRSRLFCRDGLQALRRHQAAGERVLVVTGCEYILVSAILRELGLSDLEVLGSQLRGSWSGMRLMRHNVGRRKVELLNRHGLTAWQAAYTDSAHDVPMLRPAVQVVVVNGTPALCKKIETALGRTVARVHWL